jgi:hypothetical protein
MKGCIGFVIVLAGVVVALTLPGCKPLSSSTQACFTLYSMQNGQRVDNITSIKHHERVYADTSCSTNCPRNQQVTWGDGVYGEDREHSYDNPGTYTVSYACSSRPPRRSSSSRRRHHYGSSGSHRSEVSKTLVVTP